jgi:uncharacterized protein YsxB (DUF464 family)
MITATTQDRGDGGVSLELRGHADGNASDKRGERACAGVSMLAFTLWMDLGYDPLAFKGILNAGGGHTHMWIKPEKYEVGRFVLLGLRLISQNYPLHLTLDFKATRLT